MKVILFELCSFIWNLFNVSFLYKEDKNSFYVKRFSSFLKILCLFGKYKIT
jgi:hypothetical protein